MVPCLFLGKILWFFHTCLSVSDIYVHPTSPLIVCSSTLQALLWLPSHSHCVSSCFPSSATASLLSPDFGYMVSLLPFFPASSECWCRTLQGCMAQGGLPHVPHFHQQQRNLLRCNLLCPADTREALKQISVRSKMSPIKGNLARSRFLADGSFLLVKYSWWTWSVGVVKRKITFKRNSKRRLCQNIHSSCKSLSLFRVYF